MSRRLASGGTDFSKMIQNEFLKIMDGDSMIVGSDDPKKKSVTIDCSGVSFVFCGSFETLLQNRDMQAVAYWFSRGEAEIQSEPVLFYGGRPWCSMAMSAERLQDVSSEIAEVEHAFGRGF
ncbi:MAG: hypothetical protein ACLR1V_11310 [Coprococcus sp.]